jgi:ATP-dependent Clp protease protease subunit
MTETPVDEKGGFEPSPYDFLHHGVCLISRTIYLAEITEESAEQFIKRMHILSGISDEPIHVILNSAGGNWFDGLAIYDVINTSASIVTCEVVGKCMSMGTVISQACDRRFVHANACVMIHNGSQGLDGSALELEAWGRHSAVERRRLYKLLSRRSHKKSAFWRRKCAATGDYILTAEQATKLGLFDELIEVPE